MNNIKTFILMLSLTLLLIWIGNIIGGNQGMIAALIFAGVMNFVSYWFSDKIVLAMYRAREIKQDENPELYSMVKDMTLFAGIPMPRLYFIDTPMANAFATGRDPEHAAVAITRGILEILDKQELLAVIAHELSHIKNRDILIQTVAATIAGAIFMLARMAQFAAIFAGGSNRDRSDRGNGLGLLIIAILAPIAALIIQMAISRSREYQADKTGASISGKPLALANALKKLADSAGNRPSNVNPTTAHMFIVNPLNAESLLTLFSTHPPLKERINRLEKLYQEMQGYKVPKIVY